MNTHTFTDEQLEEHDRLVSDAMKEDAENIFYEAQIEAYPNKAKNLGMTVEQLQKWNRWVCDIAEAIRRLTPSTAQSREREIRTDEAKRSAHYHVGWNDEILKDWAHVTSCLDCQRIIELSASSQPKSREREILQARLEVGQHMLEVFNRGMTGEGIGKYFDGYVENLAAELSASSQPNDALVPLEGALGHARSCVQLNPASDDSCTCGLEFRIQLRAAREVADTWRKRAERLESRDAAVKLAFDLIVKANTVSILSLDEMESVVLRCLSGEIKP